MAPQTPKSSVPKATGQGGNFENSWVTSDPTHTQIFRVRTIIRVSGSIDKHIKA